MPFVSIWIPIVATVLAFLYVVFAGRFFPGFRDEILALLIAGGLWVIYLFSSIIEAILNSILAEKVGVIVIALAVILTVIVYIKYKFTK